MISPLNDMHIRGSGAASIIFSGSRDLGLVLLAFHTRQSFYNLGSINAGGVRFFKRWRHLLGSLLWFKTRGEDLNSSANLCLLLCSEKKKKIHIFLDEKQNYIDFFLFLPPPLIELCHSDQSLIGQPAPSGEKMEVQQLKVAVSAAEKSFHDVICLGSVPSLLWQQRSRERRCFWLPLPVLQYRLCSLWED